MNSINRAFAYTYQKLKKIDVAGEENLKQALKMYEKEKIVVDFVGESGARGPSSGLGFAMFMFSKATGMKIRNGHQVAFTGEINVKGDVTPVGGIYAKVKAAEASGFKMVFLPVPNKNDMELFKSQKKLRLNYVRNADELISVLFPNLKLL